MKKKLIKLSFLFAILFTVSFSASSQIYVTIRPPVPVIVRPPQPSRVHVWVNEEWEPSGSSYRYSGGHWVPPVLVITEGQVIGNIASVVMFGLRAVGANAAKDIN